MHKIDQAVILAGGRGIRLRPYTDNNPKAMFPVGGVPFIEYLVRQARSFGIKEIVILLGYLPHKIIDFLGNGQRYDLKIIYKVTPESYETGLRLKAAEEILHESFLLMYCDNYCPIDFNLLCQKYFDRGALILLSAYRNRDHYTKDNIKITDEGLVELYDKKRNSANLSGVNIGYLIVNKQVIELVKEENIGFEEFIFPILIQKRSLYAQVTEHRYYSIGSYNRLEETQRFFANKKRKFIFLDRDGTINVKAKKACYIEKVEDFRWLPNAKEAIKLLKDQGYFIILISNQPGIAKGRMTKEDLEKIHAKMQSDLEQMDCKIDRIYYCPHDWNDGCFCRKPQPGMFYKAQKEYALDLTDCIMVGDDERDIKAGEAAGCTCYLVDDNYDLLKIVKNIQYNKG